MTDTQSHTNSTPKRQHTLCLSNKITITGVCNVLTLGDKLVEVALSDNTLTITGNGFTPLHLDVEQGTLVLSGSVASLRYARAQGKESLWRRIMR